jgi:hypothetical protein
VTRYGGKSRKRGKRPKQMEACRVIGLEAPAGGRVYLADPRQPPDWRV